jgi:copper chaperone NosL
MNMPLRSSNTAFLALLFISLAGCGKQNGDASQIAIAIQKGDICTACGMEIDPQPGPRAEAYVAGKPVKFGSTRDFFAFATQPDVVHQLGALYVQDSAHIDWFHPTGDPKSFVDARTATYVGWQRRAGEMGPTFASFARQADAEAFRKIYGGVLLRFDQITPTVVTGLSDRCPEAASPFGVFAASCMSVPANDAMQN